jgi:hypothetical protein
MKRYFRILSVVLLFHAPLSSALAAGRDPAITKESSERLKEFREHPDRSNIDKPAPPEPKPLSRADIMRRDNQAIQKGTAVYNKNERLLWMLDQAADAITRNPRDHSKELEKSIKGMRDYLNLCGECEKEREIDNKEWTREILDAAQKKIINDPALVDNTDGEIFVYDNDPRCTLQPSPSDPLNPLAAEMWCPTTRMSSPR